MEDLKAIKKAQGFVTLNRILCETKYSSLPEEVSSDKRALQGNILTFMKKVEEELARRRQKLEPSVSGSSHNENARNVHGDSGPSYPDDSAKISEDSQQHQEILPRGSNCQKKRRLEGRLLQTSNAALVEELRYKPYYQRIRRRQSAEMEDLKSIKKAQGIVTLNRILCETKYSSLPEEVGSKKRALQGNILTFMKKVEEELARRRQKLEPSVSGSSHNENARNVHGDGGPSYPDDSAKISEDSQQQQDQSE